MDNEIKLKKTVAQRIKIYFREMFPIAIYIPFVIAQYFCLNFTVQSLSSNTFIYIDVFGIVGIITAFFMMLLIRTFDDLKDIKLDKELYPKRAIPRGDVLKKDIVILSITSFIILVLINVVFAQQTLLVFGIVLSYLLLSFKWFFTEKLHKKYVLLTMFTHQPIPYAVMFYLIHTALASGFVYEKFNSNHIIILLIFSLPITTWEISRKIRSAGKETAYVTFSSLLGPKTASALPVCLILLTSILSYSIGQKLCFHNFFYFILIFITICSMIFFIRFFIKPSDKNNILKTVAIVFSALLFINILIQVLIRLTVKINL